MGWGFPSPHPTISGNGFSEKTRVDKKRQGYPWCILMEPRQMGSYTEYPTLLIGCTVTRAFHSQKLSNLNPKRYIFDAELTLLP